MRAAPLISIQPWSPITRPSFTTVEAPLQMCLSAAKFKFKLSRRWRAQDHDHGDDKEDTKATQQQPSHPDPGGVRLPNPQRKVAPEPQELERQLSGSDVLKALQRASIEKAKKSLKPRKSKERDISPRPRMEMNPYIGGRQLVGLDAYTTSDTRAGPLCIKTEWGFRLEELEKRLQEIMLLDV